MFYLKKRISNEIGKVNFSHSKSINLRIIDELQVNKIKCVVKGFATNLKDISFYAINDKIYVNESINTSFCDLYELQLAATITSDLVNKTKTIKSTAYVKMNNKKHETLKSLSNFERSYDKLVSVDNVFIKSSIFSIDLYELGQLNSSVAKLLGLSFEAMQVDSNDRLDFNINNRNGLLLLKTKQKFKRLIERKRFLITIFAIDDDKRQVYIVKQFTLNLYFQQKFTVTRDQQRQVFFKQSFTDLTLKRGDKINLESIVFNPLNLNDIKFESHLAKFETNGSILYCTEINNLKTVNIFNITACTSKQCDITTMIIRINIDQIQTTTSIPTTTSTTTTTTTRTMTAQDEIKRPNNMISTENMLVFIILMSLIIISGTITSGTLIYLHRYQCCSKGSKKINSNSRKHLEISMSSDQQNGSMSSEGSRSLSCANRSLSGNTVITSDFNTLQQNRQSKVSVCNLLASQLQDNYFQSTNQVFDKDLFSEFEMLKFTLNWLPSYDQFQTVINEFEKFPKSNLGAIYHETDLNPYDQCDSQTFV